MIRHFFYFAVVLSSIFQATVAASNPAKITSGLIASDAKSFPAFNNGPNLEEIIQKSKNFDSLHKEYVIASRQRLEPTPTASKPHDQLSDIRGLVYNSDAVVIVTPRRRVSSLTDSHQFIFSDYEVDINQTYLDRGNVLADAASTVVSRPGGEIVLNGKKIRAIDEGFPLFRIGEQYLMFLHHQISGDFQVSNLDVYLIDNGSIASIPSTNFSSKSIPLASVVKEIITAVSVDPRRAK